VGLRRPLWLSWFGDQVCGRFDRRIRAAVVAVVMGREWGIAGRSGAGRPQKFRTFVILILVLNEVVAGIATIVLEVPLHWALIHQGLAVILLGAVVAHWRGLVGPYPPVTALEVRD